MGPVPGILFTDLSSFSAVGPNYEDILAKGLSSTTVLTYHSLFNKMSDDFSVTYSGLCTGL